MDPEALKGMSDNELMSTEKDVYMAAGNKIPDAARRTVRVFNFLVVECTGRMQ